MQYKILVSYIPNAKQFFILAVLLLGLLQIEYLFEVRPSQKRYQLIRLENQNNKLQLCSVTNEISRLTKTLKDIKLLQHDLKVKYVADDQKLLLVRIINSSDCNIPCVKQIKNKKLFQLSGQGNYGDFFDLIKKYHQGGIVISSFFLKKIRMNCPLSIYMSVQLL